ncbi:MAG TPA: mobilome CxxCx(11)CxxC protein [Verrucomicrobiae bacterium]|nr:mobilome CxxCx(11)CxxC protein [Verrucomicrobiae bacterium]
MDEADDELARLRQRCWTEAIHCYGTAKIFEARTLILRHRLRVLAFLGVGVPLSVGAAVTSFGIDSTLTPWFLGAASVLSVVGGILSAWALTNRWEDELSYAADSMTANRILSEEYSKLASSTNVGLSKVREQLNLLEKENSTRSSFDEKQGITEDEKRMGMRAALRQFQRKCATCGIVPTSMEPSNCGTCGNFKVRRF